MRKPAYYYRREDDRTFAPAHRVASFDELKKTVFDFAKNGEILLLVANEDNEEWTTDCGHNTGITPEERVELDAAEEAGWIAGGHDKSTEAAACIGHLSALVQP